MEIPFRQPHIPAQPASPLQNNEAAQNLEDDEEWEYEYSETETETYYLTIDLTAPHNPGATHATYRNGRAKKQAHSTKTWANPGLGFYVDPATGIRETGAQLLDGPDPGSPRDAEEDDDEEVAKEFFDHTKNSLGAPVPKQSLLQGPEEVKEEIPVEVQIMDLHTPEPLVSYGGKIYMCKWSLNMGTELLFTRRDEANPLPAVRSLPNGVDILAASSIRLTSNLLDVQAKSLGDEARNVTALAKPGPGPLSNTCKTCGGNHGKHEVGCANKTDSLIRPVSQRSASIMAVPKNPHQLRNIQRSFLDGLQNIKQAKGDQDEVTMLLKKIENGKLETQMRLESRAEIQRLQALVKSAGHDALTPDEAAYLEKMEEQDRLRKIEKPTSRKRGPKPRDGVKRKRSPGGAFRRNAQELKRLDEMDSGDDGEEGGEDETMLESELGDQGTPSLLGTPGGSDDGF